MNTIPGITGTLYIISAPSGAGKTSLVTALLKALPDIRVSVSHTTRDKRASEENHANYHFVTHAEFKDLISQNVFLEHAKVFDHFYGTSKKWVQETRSAGNDVILEIDWQGARQVRSHFADIQSIFIFPPSNEALVERLQKRHPDNPALVEQRMKEAREDISHYSEYDFLICNDRFEEALEDILNIIRGHRLRVLRQNFALEPIIKKLLS
jgi:guanylate kinase